MALSAFPHVSAAVSARCALKRCVHLVSPLVRLGLLVRQSEIWLAAAAAFIGLASGAAVLGISALAHAMQVALFGLQEEQRLSSMDSLRSPVMYAVPFLGGIILVVATIWLKRSGRRLVDPVEANALHGGRMSLSGSCVITLLTIVSNGFGASVGLEAAYVQMGGAFGSKVGAILKSRRADVRLLLGSGAAAAIAAAFNAPLTGAFYAFELIIGSYTISAAAPVILAALAGAFVSSKFGHDQSEIHFGPVPDITPEAVVTLIGLSVLTASCAIVLMRSVSWVERLITMMRIPRAYQPLAGGLMLAPVAALAPFALSAGHGAFQEIVSSPATPLWPLLGMIAIKGLASAISLGCGYRGGLFFASLFIGALIGQAYTQALVLVGVGPIADHQIVSLAGMAGLATAVVGGPITMAFLALELSASFPLSMIILGTAVVSSAIVRQTFGYSFTTWRFHLRGESIRGAHDVGYIRNLVVRRMMRADIETVSLPSTIGGLRELFPLGSAKQIVVKDAEGEYRGIIPVVDLHAAEESRWSASACELLQRRETVLWPEMSARAAAEVFELEACDFLAVVASKECRRVVGSLTEGFLLRRYAEEMDKMQSDMCGHGRL